MTAFAFMFPGQGSQSVGMLNAWGDHPAVRQALAEASDALDQDLSQLIAEGPADVLALTSNTQPVMLVAGVAAYRAWLAEGGAEPAVVAGHSLGEYSALVASGALTLTQAAPLVRFRAQSMQRAVPVGTGAMAAILGLESAQVKALCEESTRQSGEVAEAVNFNDPAQTVIAGSKAGVDAACMLLKASGAKRALPLSVSAPFHSSLMRPAAEELRGRLADVDFAVPRIPVVNNVDVASPTDADALRDALYRQAFGPVRWVEVVRAMAARGASTLVECGPGKVLAGMVRRIDPALQGIALYDPTTLAQARQQVLA